MIIYRLSKIRYSDDLAGSGCLYHPGRWNKVGTRVLYASENVSLAILEVLANSEVTPKDYCIVCIEVPKEATIYKLEAGELPATWNKTPYTEDMAEITEKWIQEGKSLLMRIPSVHSPLDYNILVNPGHPLASKLRILKKIPYHFDNRLKGD